MDPRPTASLLAMEKLRRLAVTAVSHDVDLEPLQAALEPVDEQSYRECLVAVDETFQGLAVQLRWPHQEIARQGVFDVHAVWSPEHNDRILPLLERSTRDPLIEWRCGAGGTPLGCTIHSVGARPLAEDIERVIEAARQTNIVRDAMSAIAEPLAGGASGQCDGVSDEVAPYGQNRWYLRFVHPNDTPVAMARTMKAIESIAIGLDVTESQRQAFMTLHPVLSQRRPTIASISLSDGGRDQSVGVEYAPVSWDSAQRLMQGFCPRQSPGRRLGALARTSAAGQVAMIRLELRHIEPPGLRIWAELTSELSVGRR